MMADTGEYIPPRVWTFEKENGGAFASINRPTAGPRFERELQRGKHPLQLYSLGTANGIKITTMLEELLALGFSEAEYDAWLININEGDQFGSGFTALNPNSKVPALIDYSIDPPVRIFESGAILLYLAEKFGRFLPTDLQGRMECLSWVFWLVGSAPYYGGGFGHFYYWAPIKLEYPIDRYTMEVKRQLDVLERQLTGRSYILGDDYSIADISIFPWYGGLVLNWGKDVSEFLSLHEYPNVLRWAERVSNRPAVQRGRRVNRIFNFPGGIAERHDPSDLND
jgi:GST-like protein